MVALDGAGERRRLERWVQAVAAALKHVRRKNGREGDEKGRRRSERARGGASGVKTREDERVRRVGETWRVKKEGKENEGARQGVGRVGRAWEQRKGVGRVWGGCGKSEQSVG
eukprot:804754-Rhodomonas_salina.2